jgi:putative flippase GtrA
MSQIRKQLLRFMIVGTVSTLLNFLTYYLVYKAGVNLVIASVLGYMVGLINSYQFGKIWVFESKGNEAKYVLLRFALVYAIGGAGMSGIVEFLDQTLSWDYRICWFWGTAFAFTNNFVGSKLLVFKEIQLRNSR